MKLCWFSIRRFFKIVSDNLRRHINYLCLRESKHKTSTRRWTDTDLESLWPLTSTTLSHRWMLNIHCLSIFRSERNFDSPLACLSPSLAAFTCWFCFIACQLLKSRAIVAVHENTYIFDASYDSSGILFWSFSCQPMQVSLLALLASLAAFHRHFRHLAL